PSGALPGLAGGAGIRALLDVGVTRGATHHTQALAVGLVADPIEHRRLEAAVHRHRARPRVAAGVRRLRAGIRARREALVLRGAEAGAVRRNVLIAGGVVLPAVRAVHDDAVVGERASHAALRVARRQAVPGRVVAQHVGGGEV